MTLQVGTRLGPYEIEAAVGAGGQGEVYRARDTRLERTVAIKVLPEALAADPQFRDRFDREARVISSLDHPHICTLHDVGEQDGMAYLVMQYLEGETLSDRIARRGKPSGLPIEDALQVAIQIGSALDAAHRAGIVHRDLKPRNIMLTKAGAKLALTAVSVQTTPGFSAGNPTKLFETRYHSAMNMRSYDVSPDGRRFLMIKDMPGANQQSNVTPASIVVVLNWFEELKARLP